MQRTRQYTALGTTGAVSSSRYVVSGSTAALQQDHAADESSENATDTGVSTLVEQRNLTIFRKLWHTMYNSRNGSGSRQPTLNEDRGMEEMKVPSAEQKEHEHDEAEEDADGLSVFHSSFGRCACRDAVHSNSGSNGTNISSTSTVSAFSYRQMPADKSQQQAPQLRCLGILDTLVRQFELYPDRGNKPISLRKRAVYVAVGMTVYNTFAIMVALIDNRAENKYDSQDEVRKRLASSLSFALMGVSLNFLFALANVISLRYLPSSMLWNMLDLLAPKLRPSTMAGIRRSINAFVVIVVGVQLYLYATVILMLPFVGGRHIKSLYLYYQIWGAVIADEVANVSITFFTFIVTPVSNALTLVTFGMMMVMALLHRASVQELAHLMLCRNANEWQRLPRGSLELDAEVRSMIKLHSTLVSLVRATSATLQNLVVPGILVLFFNLLLLLQLLLGQPGDKWGTEETITFMLFLFMTLLVTIFLAGALWVLGSIDREASQMTMLTTHLSCLSTAQKELLMRRFSDIKLTWVAFVPISNQISVRLLFGSISALVFVIQRAVR